MSRAPVIVIGAGFGGLAAAVDLARAGERVVVLERELRPGGKARSIDVGGRSVDVGPTVLTMRWVFDELFAAAGRSLDDAVTIRPAEILARHGFTDGSVLDLFADLERSVAAIRAFAGPREAEAYREFAARSQRIAETVREPFLLADRPGPVELARRAGKVGLGALARIDAHRSMSRSLAATFHDPRLRALFARYATYVGSSPHEAPATFNLVAHVEREGVGVVEGGMSRLAAATHELAASLGVTFHFGARVREILEEGGRAAGVLVQHEDGAREMLRASAVVANADVATLASGVLGASAARAVKAVPVKRRSLSALTWAITGRAKGFPLAYHNVFFSADYDRETRRLWQDRMLPDDPTVYVCAFDRAAEATPDGEERFFVIVNAPADADVKPTDPEATARCERAMFARLAAAGVDLSPSAVVRITPATYEQLAPGTGGAIYGEVAHGAMAPLSRQASRTSMPGLYVAGGSAHPGPGVPMATLSGRLVAEAVTRDLAPSKRAIVFPWQGQHRDEHALGEAREAALATRDHRGEA